MIRAGLLGLGTIGSVHLEEAYAVFEKNNEPIRLEACFDIDEKNFDKADDVRKYTDLDAFFEGEKGRLDYIDICLPTFMHKDVSVKAMKYGFNVLCEKPMALSFEDAFEMCRVSEETGKTLMIAHVLRFDRDLKLIRDYVKNEKLGKIRNTVYSVYGTGLPNGKNNWFKDKSLSGGPVLDMHIHDADTLLWILGMPEAISTVANKKTEESGYEAFSTNLIYADGVYANTQCDWGFLYNGHNNGRTIRINFENGYIIKDNNMFITVDANGAITDLSQKDRKNIFYDEIKYFAETLMNKETVDFCPPQESMAAIKFIEAEIKSADNSGEIIMLK